MKPKEIKNRSKQTKNNTEKKTHTHTTNEKQKICNKQKTTTSRYLQDGRKKTHNAKKIQSICLFLTCNQITHKIIYFFCKPFHEHISK